MFIKWLLVVNVVHFLLCPRNGTRTTVLIIALYGVNIVVIIGRDILMLDLIALFLLGCYLYFPFVILTFIVFLVIIYFIASLCKDSEIKLVKNDEK